MPYKNDSTVSFTWKASGNEVYTFDDPLGRIFFVNSASAQAANDTAHGFSPETPVLSIAYAITRCTDNNNDVILCASNHVETIDSAGDVTCNKIGVRIIGLGWGQKRTKVNFTTATGASWDITAAGVTVENIWFKNAIDAQTAMVNVQAADVIIQDCDFDHADGSTQAVLCILGNSSAHRLWVIDNYFHGTANAGTDTAISLVGGDDIKIIGNEFVGNYHASNGIIKNATTDCLRLLVRGNTFQNFTAANTKAMVFTAASTGQISDNRIQILSGSAPITGAAMSWVGSNRYANAVASGGNEL